MRSLAIFCPLVIGLFAACPGVPEPLERPRVTVDEVAARPAGASTVRVHLSALNPNPWVLTARALDWQLSVDGVPAVRGRESLDVSIAARRTADIFWQMSIPAPAASAMSERAASGLTYELRGTVHLFGQRGDIGATFHGAGPVGALVAPSEMR